MSTVIKVIENVTTIILALSPFFPLVVAGIRYYGTKTKNNNITNLANRADIIVKGLDKIELTNPDKRDLGINKLVEYANEIGVSLTPDQAVDYINSAVLELRQREAALIG